MKTNFGSFRSPVQCGFDTTIISQLVNAGSVAELVRRVSDMYHIFHEDEADFLSGVCPDCEINDARAFEPYDVTMDLAGTTQEGRPDRIEQLKIGDEVRFVREPDNPYDTNAIDVRSEQGSLGHVHGEIAKFLSPLMDQGISTCEKTIIGYFLCLYSPKRWRRKTIYKINRFT